MCPMITTSRIHFCPRFLFYPTNKRDKGFEQSDRVFLCFCWRVGCGMRGWSQDCSIREEMDLAQNGSVVTIVHVTNSWYRKSKILLLEISLYQYD